MAFMLKQARRLLRPGIVTPEQILQEVFAVFASGDPIEMSSPLVMEPSGDNVAPLTIIMQPGPDGTYDNPIDVIGQGPPLDTDRVEGTIPTVPPWTGLPGYVTDSSGTPREDDRDGDVPQVPGSPPPPGVPPVPPFVPPPPPDTGDTDPSLSLGGGGGNAYRVTVGSQVSGSSYNCTSVDSAGNAGPTTCEIENVDASATVPSGVKCPGVKAGSTLYAYPPAFVEDP